jgi:uncharacterized protein
MNNIKFDDYDVEEAAFDQPAVLININALYKPNMGEDALYQVTRKYWRINLDRVKKIRIACAIYQGIIKGVFIIRDWKIEENRPDGRKYFEGEVACDELCNKYIGKSVKSYWPYGSQNPIKYAYYEANGIKYKS